MCAENKMTNNGPMWAPSDSYRSFLGIMPGFCPYGTHLSMLSGQHVTLELHLSDTILLLIDTM